MSIEHSLFIVNRHPSSLFFQVPPLLAQLKMQGDERFRAHDYEKAAHLYLMGLNYPVPLFMAEVPAVSEQLFRRRAVCLYKMVSSIIFEITCKFSTTSVFRL